MDLRIGHIESKLSYNWLIEPPILTFYCPFHFFVFPWYFLTLSLCFCLFIVWLFECCHIEQYVSIIYVKETITWTDSHFVCHSRGQYYNGYMYTKYLGKIEICLKLQPQLMCILKGWGWNSERSLCTSGIRHVFIYQRRYYVVGSVQKLWLGRSVYQVRFFNLTLSAGVVSVVCLSSVGYHCHWAFFSGSIYSHVHVVK